MAQQVHTQFIDDLDGAEAAGTVSFALDGASYEIDLSSAHSSELHATLDQYIAHARRVTPRRGSRGGRRRGNAVDTAKVREWAKDHGIDIKERGRVPATVTEQYRAAVGA